MDKESALKSNMITCLGCNQLCSQEHKFCDQCGAHFSAALQLNHPETDSQSASEQIHKLNQYLVDLSLSAGQTSAEYAEALEHFSLYLRKHQVNGQKADDMLAQAIAIRSQLNLTKSTLLPESDGQICPFCAEIVRKEAITCKHCGKQLHTGPEILIYEGTLHWIIYLNSAFWLIFFTGSIIVIPNEYAGYIFPLLLVASISLVCALTRQYFSEFHITNRRVLLKTGIIARRTKELLLQKIETVNVDQGILDRIVNAGYIEVTGTGSTHERLPSMSEPFQFRDVLVSTLPDSQPLHSELSYPGESRTHKIHAETTSIVLMILVCWFLSSTRYIAGVRIFPTDIPSSPPASEQPRTPTSHNDQAAKNPQPSPGADDTEIDQIALIDQIAQGVQDNDMPAFYDGMSRLEAQQKPIPGNRTGANQLNKIGLKHLRAKSYKEATNFFESASKADPSDAKLLSNLGFAEMQDGQLDAALEHLQSSIALSPSRAVAWGNLGETFAKQGNKQKAVACLLVGYIVSNGDTLTFLQSLMDNDDANIREAGKIALEKIRTNNPGTMDSESSNEVPTSHNSLLWQGAISPRTLGSASSTEISTSRGPELMPLSSQTPQVDSPSNNISTGTSSEGNSPVGSSVQGKAAFDFAPYMADVQRRIKRAWFPPRGNESKRIIVIFRIHRGGDISNLRLEQSSGIPTADQAALKAVNNAAPFHPLPEAASEEPEVRFSFDYNRFGGEWRQGMSQRF